MTTYCPLSPAAPAPSDHRCPACQLLGDLRRANSEISLLRSEVARLSGLLTNARSALYDESEASALAHRRLARLTGERDAIREAFEDAKEVVAQLEKERDAREYEPDSNRVLGLVGL